MKYIEFFAALGFMGWLVHDPSPEPAIMLLIAIGGFVFSESRDMGSRQVQSIQERRMEADRKLFGNFGEELPSTGIIRILREEGLTQTFQMKDLMVLSKFRLKWISPEQELHDEDLNVGMKLLLKSIGQLLDVVMEYTDQVPQATGYCHIPTEWKKDPARFRQAIKKLHAASDGVVDAHQKFIRLGRKSLGV